MWYMRKQTVKGELGWVDRESVRQEGGSELKE
jgi:hypothetical protein